MARYSGLRGNLSGIQRGAIEKFAYLEGEIERILSPHPNKWGYLIIGLQKDKKQKYFLVHTLVARAFLGMREKGLECNHKDGNKHNNTLSNLEYCTRSENLIHKYRVLKVPQNRFKGEDNGMARLSERDVIEIRAKYASKGYTQEELARTYHTSFGNISAIVRRKIWKHI